MTLRPTLLAASLGLALASCGGEPAASGPRPGSALEALYEYNDAMAALDKERAQGWVLPGDVQLEFFEKSFAVGQAIRRFKDAVRDAYGEAGLAQVLTSPGGQTLLLDVGLSRAELAGVALQQQGDLAFAHLPGGAVMRLLRHEGRWRVDMIGSHDAAEIEAARRRQDYQLEVMGPTLDRARSRLSREDPDLAAFEKYVDGELERALSQDPGAQPPR